MNHAEIAGTGSYVPQKIMTNEDLERIVDTSDEWILSRTGIRQRRISEGENTSSLAAKAAIKALEDAKMDADDLDLIIVATVTQDTFTPSVSCLVQVEIGAKNASCFDITAGCSGFIYGINIGTQFINSGQYKNILVIGAEVLSKVTNWEDRNTCVLFGDGAGAVVLKASDNKGIISVYMGASGDENRYLEIPGIEVNNPFSPEVISKPSYIKMNGLEIFKFATKIIRKSFKNVLQNTDYSLDDIKYIIPHQANYRIINHVAQKAKIDINKFYLNLEKYGNTSSASIGIALDEMNKKGLLSKDDKIIMVGFGGGLTWGAILLKWNK
ncbi:beta-ketoacyl-ACP synthase III [Abyssisolibacter fermentans]|uniref:beta-ketoacyl-ACP synthase III n=1 Tax=Abyssisolibacter fermentans TaxID=1766203 RepID=UPI0008372DF9|nr:beta-ketoacyl-ACP synthase III [Abyssisolibacter fermentans]